MRENLLYIYVTDLQQKFEKISVNLKMFLSP